MKKSLALLTVLVTCSANLFFAPSVKASTCPAAGPCGSNGLRAVSGPARGQVTLDWSRVSLNGENYSIHYGTQPGVYPYAASYIGYVATYTVGNLVPGQTYYFALERIWTGNVSVGWDGEVSARAATSASSPVVTSGPIGRNLLEVKAIGGGKAILTWHQYFADTTGWHIVYGKGPGMFTSGVLNAVSTTPGVTTYSFTIGAMTPGRWYFALAPVRGGQAQYITAEVSTVVR